MNEFDSTVQDLFEKGPSLEPEQNEAKRIIKDFAGSWKVLVIPVSYTAIAFFYYFMMKTSLVLLFEQVPMDFSMFGGVEAYVNSVSMTGLVISLIATIPVWLIYFGGKSESNLTLTGVQIIRVVAQIARVILYIGIVLVVFTMFAGMLASPGATLFLVVLYAAVFVGVIIFYNRFIDFLQDIESVLKGHAYKIPDASKLRIFLVLLLIISIIGVLGMFSATQMPDSNFFDYEGTIISLDFMDSFLYISLAGTALIVYWLYVFTQYQKLK